MAVLTHQPESERIMLTRDLLILLFLRYLPNLYLELHLNQSYHLRRDKILVKFCSFYEKIRRERQQEADSDAVGSSDLSRWSIRASRLPNQIE